MDDLAKDRRQGRIFCLAAAVLWSFSGLFTRLLQKDTFLNLNETPLSPIQMAFFRAIFAGLFLIPFLSRKDMKFRPIMPIMVAIFAGMNALFLSSMALGSAAATIFLQYMAPFLVYLIGVNFMGEEADRKTWRAILMAMVGVLIIVFSGFTSADSKTPLVTLMAVGSGVLYALVICCLRYLRGQSSIWLTLLNQLGSGICLGLGVIIFSGVDEFLAWFTGPTLNQFVFLACFGAVQMGFSYYFFARGLKKLSPQEAGFITLLEPILNPLWVWLAFGETNPISIWIGGAFILFALGWRYSSKT